MCGWRHSSSQSKIFKTLLIVSSKSKIGNLQDNILTSYFFFLSFHFCLDAQPCRSAPPTRLNSGHRSTSAESSTTETPTGFLSHTKETTEFLLKKGDSNTMGTTWQKCKLLPGRLLLPDGSDKWCIKAEQTHPCDKAGNFIHSERC